MSQNTTIAPVCLINLKNTATKKKIMHHFCIGVITQIIYPIKYTCLPKQVKQLDRTKHQINDR